MTEIVNLKERRDQEVIKVQELFDRFWQAMTPEMRKRFKRHIKALINNKQSPQGEWEPPEAAEQF